MIHMYRFFRWYAGFALAIARASGNHDWIARERDDLAHWEAVCDRMEALG